MLYASRTAGFLSDEIHASIPDDAVEIAPEQHAALLAGQAAGKTIVFHDGSAPTLADPPGPATVRTASELKAYAASKRYAVETGGVAVAGMTIVTTRESQGLINGAFNMAKDDPSASFDFKAQSGWATLTADQAIAVGRTVGAHVRACFSVERALEASINAGEITTTGQVDAAAWPSNA